ncbi:hypothetical protein A7U60_g4567 [Sanghuangporus baumii]|uniref:Uncharacterized protein n=1 Tax=Sanghuangporus baumii TaxID=108892 RepID=A0A9Q5N555_SANBA|nr:hypothetical protein A7U60_g4567 [Sanghuangporus baumii]
MLKSKSASSPHPEFTSSSPPPSPLVFDQSSNSAGTFSPSCASNRTEHNKDTLDGSTYVPLLASTTYYAPTFVHIDQACRVPNDVLYEFKRGADTLVNAPADQSRSSGRFYDAIFFQQAALDRCPNDHPDRSAILHSLACILYKRHELWRDVDELEREIVLDRAALKLRPEGHAYRSSSLGNLSTSLRTRYEHYGKMKDLEEAVSGTLKTRFEHDGRMEDLEEAISMERTLLEHRPEGHPHHSSSLDNLAKYLYVRYEVDGNVLDLAESIPWATIARSHDHNPLMEAHKSAMSLLQRALTINPSLSEQHDFLRRHNRYQSLALELASHFIDKGGITQAIEFLEQGRALLRNLEVYAHSPSY